MTNQEQFDAALIIAADAAKQCREMYFTALVKATPAQTSMAADAAFNLGRVVSVQLQLDAGI